VRAALVSLACLASAACTATPEQVAARCEREAQASTSVAGEFSMGVASGFNSNPRFVSDADLALSAGVNLGGGAGDPRFAYEQCVRERTGQGPVRPYGVS
jgi:hypothetical protein